MENKRKAHFADEGEHPPKRVCRRPEFMFRGLQNARSAIIPPTKCFLGSDGLVLDRTIPRLECGIKHAKVSRKHVLIEHHPTENRLVMTNIGQTAIQKNDSLIQPDDAEFLDVNDLVGLVLDEGEEPVFQFELIETSQIGTSRKLTPIDKSLQMQELNEKKKAKINLDHFLQCCERSGNLNVESILIYGSKIRAYFKEGHSLIVRHRSDAIDFTCKDPELSLPLFFALCTSIQSKSANLTFLSNDDLENFNFEPDEDHGIWLPFESIQAKDFSDGHNFKDVEFDSSAIRVNIGELSLHLDIFKQSLHWTTQQGAPNYFLDGSLWLASLVFTIKHCSVLSNDGLLDYAVKIIIQQDTVAAFAKHIQKATISLSRGENANRYKIENLQIKRAFSIDDNFAACIVNVCGKNYSVSLNCLKSADVQLCTSESGSGVFACPGAMLVLVSLNTELQCVSIPKLRALLAETPDLRPMIVPNLTDDLLKPTWIDQIDFETHQLTFEPCDLPADLTSQVLADAFLAYVEVFGKKTEASSHLEHTLQGKCKNFVQTLGSVIVANQDDDFSDDQKQKICKTLFKETISEKLAELATSTESDPDSIKIFEFAASCMTDVSGFTQIISAVAEKFKSNPDLLRDALAKMKANVDSIGNQFAGAEIVALLKFDETQDLCVEKIRSFKGNLSDIPPDCHGKFASCFIRGFVNSGDKTMLSTILLLSEKDVISAEDSRSLIGKISSGSPSILCMRILMQLTKRGQYREQGKYCLKLITKYKNSEKAADEAEMRQLIQVVFDVLKVKTEKHKPGILTEVLLLALTWKEDQTFDLCISRYEQLEITNQGECLEFLYTQKFRSTQFLEGKSFEELHGLLIKYSTYIDCVEYLKRKIQTNKIPAEELMELEEGKEWPKLTFSKLANQFGKFQKNVKVLLAHTKGSKRILKLKEMHDCILKEKLKYETDREKKIKESERQKKIKKCNDFAEAIRKKAAKEVGFINAHLRLKLQQIVGCGDNHRKPETCAFCMSKAQDFLPLLALQSVQQTFGGKVAGKIAIPIFRKTWFNRDEFMKFKLDANTALAKLLQKKVTWIFPN